MENNIHILKSINNKQNMSFIIANDNGGIILIDGGYKEDVSYLLDYLKKLNNSNIAHVDAIWLTHPHIDHIESFLYLIKEHQNDFLFDAIYYHFPSEKYISDDKDVVLLEEFNRLLPCFFEKCHIVHQHDIYDIKGTKFEVLYTVDEKAIKNNRTNNSSVVFKCFLNGKSILFLGDIGEEASDIILQNMPYNTLKADYCQMAHHGQGGPNKNFYEIVSPQLGCFWNAPKWLYDNDLGNGFDTGLYKTIVTRKWMEEIAPDHIDYCITDGTKIVKI